MSKKTKQPKPVKCGRVTHVTAERLFNLGNYQNVKFSVGAEIPPGASASETFRRLNLILNDLRPITRFEGHEKKYLEELRGKTAKELSEFQKNQIEELTEKELKFSVANCRRTAALEALDDLGGHSLFKDAKEEWSHSDDDTEF